MKNKSATLRDSNIELLRIVLMLMIVIHHFLVHGTGLRNIAANSYIVDKETPYYFLINSFLVVSVNCFIFITGFYGIHFKMKTIINLVLQAMFYSVGITVIFYLFSLRTVGIVDFFLSFFPVTTGFWWFLTTYVFLFLLSPFLNTACERLTKNQFLYIICIFTVLNCIVGFIFAPFSLGTEKGYSLIGFIYIYLLGRYISKYPVTVQRFEKYSFVIYFTCSLIVFCLAIFSLKYLRQNIAWKMFSYNNPLVLIAAIAFFFGFKRFSFKSVIINTAAQCVFGVYLIDDHSYIRENMGNLAHHFFSHSSIYLHLLSIFVTAFFVLVICISIEKVRQVLFVTPTKFVYKLINIEKLDRIFS